MPYVIKKFGKKYKVCKTSGKCFSKKPIPLERAKRQRKALYANEKNSFVDTVYQILLEKD
jgi:hypothetical protein